MFVTLGTPFILASIAFGIFLAHGITRRWSTDGKKTDWMTQMIWCVVFSIMSYFFVLGVMSVAQSAKIMLTAPRYEATIVSFESEMVTQTREGRSWNVLLHTPNYRFTDDNGRTVTLTGTVSNVEEPDVGEIVTVAYREGEPIHEITGAAMMLAVVFGAIALVLGYILWRILTFVLGRKETERS